MDPLPREPDADRTRELLARVRVGDRAAGDELYLRHRDELLFLVRARLGTRLRGVLQSDDVLQSVALEAFRALPDFEDRGPKSFARWLRQIVVNKIRDETDRWSAARRDLGRVVGDEVLAAAHTSDAVPPRYHDERYVALERALSTLPDDMREIVVLRRVEGLSSRESADRLGRTDAAARQLYSRAMARIAVQMGVERGEQR